MGKKIFRNFVPDSNGIRYKMAPNADGTVSLEDVTSYTVQGDSVSAEVLNSLVQEEDAITDAEIDSLFAPVAGGDV